MEKSETTTKRKPWDQGDLGRTTSGSRGLRESDVATTTSEQPALSEVHNFYSCTFSE